jgi:hypothetical protein
MPGPEKLTPADPSDLAAVIEFGLRFHTRPNPFTRVYPCLLDRSWTEGS